MAKTKPKRNDSGGTPGKAGNTSSPPSQAPARPWTDEEMAGAQPLPLPSVDTTAEVRPHGVPHAGKGKTAPAGRPEDEEKTARQ